MIDLLLPHSVVYTGAVQKNNGLPGSALFIIKLSIFDSNKSLARLCTTVNGGYHNKTYGKQ